MTNAFSQKIFGTIKDNKGNLLPYSSVTIKGSTTGVTANNLAQYSFSLKPGKYIVVCQHIGFESVEKSIDIQNDVALNFVMHEQQLLMKEVVIGNGLENPAYEIIRQAIKKRDYYNNQINGFECNVYSKDVIKLRNLPDKIFGQKVPDNDRNSMGLDSSGKGIIYLSEAFSKVYSQRPDKFKMNVLSSRLSGSNSFGFTFPTFINMYTNNVSIFDAGFNKRGFVSPIADGAIRYYKFKMQGTYVENGKTINVIKVIPRRKYEPLFTGVINITDDDWRIHSFDLTVTKSSQLEFLDTLRITQQHLPIDENTWRVKNQLIYFSFDFFKVDAAGDFLTVYSDYKLNPVFDKKLFNKILIKYDTGVSGKSKEYWDTLRPVQLENDETEDYRKKDSLFKLRQDSSYVDNNIDTLRKRQGKLKPFSILFPGVNRTHYGKNGNYQWGIDPVFLNLNYNCAEGLVSQLSGYIDRYYKGTNKKIFLQPVVRYGFSNRHFNGWLNIALKNQKNKNESNSNRLNWYFSLGKKVSQYNNDNPVEPLINTISTLSDGKNVMKTYEKKYFGLSVKKKFESGFGFSAKAVYEDRNPIFNTTNYTFKKADTINLTENYPVEKSLISEIVKHKAFIASVELSFKPGLKFIQFPQGRMPLGSKYPTFILSYSKGINGFLGSEVKFDKWNLDVNDEMNLKLAGLVKYKFVIGGFIDTTKVFIQDYKHFNSNPLRATSTYVEGFQLMNSYQNSNISPLFLEAHVEHHFNGLLTNKIPLFKKLNWNLVGGANAFYINKTNNYIEYFVGLENIFKILRIDFVSAYQSGKYLNSTVVFGFDGMLGGNISQTPATRTFPVNF